MKKNLLVCLLVTVCFFFIKTGYAQNFPATEDSIKTMICKKWEVDHALMMGMQIGKEQGAPDMVFEFRPDKTYTATSSTDKDKHMGKWEVDMKNKNIRLYARDKHGITIISVSPDELIMKFVPQDKNDKESENTQLVLKIKS